MPEVAIIGAGDVGGTIAHRLAARGRVRAIRLIDPAAQMASGKALDIRQAGPIDGSDTSLEASSDPRDAVGAAVTIVADAAGGTSSPEDDDLEIVRTVARLTPGTVIVCALASHRRLVERGVREAAIQRARIVGSAPSAYVSGLRALVAAALDVSAADVTLSVVGLLPEHAVVAWSSATVAGHRLEDVATAADLGGIRQRSAALWPPGPYSLASAAARVCEAILGGSHREVACWVSLDGEFGVRGTAAAMPVTFGPEGLRRVVIPPLTRQEQTALDNALGR